MAVPAHDTRDFEFARQFDIPIRAVVDPQDAPGVDREQVLAGREVYVDHGKAINSGPYDGLSTDQFKTKITADLAAKGLGRAAVNYKLRDWLFSRQRFWGEPFPILHELDADGRPTGLLRTVPAEELPVDLPKLDDFRPHGRPEPPLEKAPDEWLYPVIDGKKYKRETNTMPQWAGSCWYYLRFIDPKNDQALVDPAKEKAWMPVDLYIGGIEHAVLHRAVCPILAQGAVRSRSCEHDRAVPEAGESGNGPGRAGIHRLPAGRWMLDERRCHRA